jgi:hypothetical protein
MIKKISLLAAAITMILVSIVFAQNNSLSFGEVVDNLNLAKNTSLAVETYWLEIKGAEVTWSGEVVDVKGGKGKAKISIANKNRSTYKGYNIVLETFDMEGAAKLKIGQDVRFNGLISDYKGKKGNPIIVYLNSVEFK